VEEAVGGGAEVKGGHAASIARRRRGNAHTRAAMEGAEAGVDRGDGAHQEVSGASARAGRAG
jgi:hypothetical protein